ncbi:MAG: efflux RND transporter periplasmic adaptor subunit, partial [Burkholderiales bacterium]
MRPGSTARQPRLSEASLARVLAGVAVVGLLALGMFSGAGSDPARAQAANQTGVARGEIGPALVRAQPASEVIVFPLREAQASVVARNVSRIAAEISARIVELRVEIAEPVQRGQVLARLDDADYRLALASARARRDGVAARLNLAQVQLERGRTLQTQKFLSPEALTQRETEVAALKAELRAFDVEIETAKRQIAKALVRAPFNAVVTDRAAQRGELAVPGAPLFTLVETDAQEVSAAVPLALADDLAAATEPAFASAGASLPLKLLRISPVASRETRSREARLAFTGERAIPGAEGRLVWRSSRPHVPADLVVRREGRLGIFVLEGAAGGHRAR